MGLTHDAAAWCLATAMAAAGPLHPKLRSGWRQRLGMGLGPALGPRSRFGPRVWLHGASAGDVQALEPLARRIRQHLPQAALWFSAMTDTGLAAAARMDARGTFAVPWDAPGPTRRVARALAPDLLVLEAAEIWPCLIRAVSKRGGAVALVNGRLAERRMPGYRMLARWADDPFERINLYCMATHEDAERVRRLGVSPDRIHVTGNTKADRSPVRPSPELVRCLSAPPGSASWIAGSIHPKEERGVLMAHAEMTRRRPVRLVVAQRYRPRARALVSNIRSMGLRAGRRSQGHTLSDVDVLVLDTWGELAAAYACFDVAFVGGSWIPRGGHDLLEPARHGTPVLFGPFVRDAGDLEARGGGRTVRSAEELAGAAERWFADGDRRTQAGEAARRVARTRAGATDRVWTLLSPRLAGWAAVDSPESAC